MADREMEKMLAALQRLMAEQQPSDEQELTRLLDGMMGKTADELSGDTGPLTPQQQAEQLVYQAADLGDIYGRDLLEGALDLDPACIFAFEMLGEFERSPLIANVFFEKGIALGRRQFGGDFLKKHKGIFWMVHETRPFMRCMASSAACFAALDQKQEAIELYREMLALNPNDNQGVRELLSLYLVAAGDYAGFNELQSTYPGDLSVFMVYNALLAAFKQYGAMENSLALLRVAKERNPHVIKKLRAKSEPKNIPSMYAIGSPEEAVQYVMHARTVWQQTPGAIEFLAQAPKASRKKKQPPTP